MDLRWQMALLTMRARRGPRNQDNKYKESLRRSVPVETSIALVSFDGLGGYDWSDEVEEGPNYALMAFLSLSSDSKIVDNYKKGLGYENYNAVLPPYTRNFMPPTPDLSFTGLDEFVNKPIVEYYKAKSSEEEPNVVRKNDDALIIKEWVSDNEEEDGNPQMNLQDQRVIDSGCSRYMTGNMSYLIDYEEIDGGYVAFGRNPKGWKSTGKDHLGKFDGKADEGFFVGYSLYSKAFRVFNSRTRIVEENLHIRFSKTIPNVVGSGLDWLFDIDVLTRKMNYEPIVAGTQSNGFADPKSSHDDGSKPLSDDGKKVDEDPRKENECNDQEKEINVNNTNKVNTVSSTVNATGINEDNELPFDPNMPALEDVSIFNFLSDDEDDGTMADMNNLDTIIQVSHIPTIRIHKDHPLDQVIRDFQSTTHTRKMSKNLKEHGFKKDGKFISQDKYVAKILKKFRFTDVKTASTPIETQNPLLKDEDGKDVDVHMYRSMIGSLMYLTSSKPNIMFAVCACARYQVNPKVSHLHAMKRIFRDLQLADEEGIDCLPNSTIFEQLPLMGPKTTAWNEFSSTMASAIIYLATNQKFNFSKWIFDSMIRNLDNVFGKFLMYPRIGRGFSSRVTPLFQKMVIQNQSELGEGSAMPTDPHHTPMILQPSSSQTQKKQKPRKPKRKDTQKMRIEQYFLMADYSLWEVILNGDSPTPTRVINSVVQDVPPTTTKQRLAKKNELKARGTLLMALPDKHKLKFNIHKDAKCLMEAIEKRFGGNKETKKVQKTLLEQQYENFTGSSSKSLDQIHDRLQKLIIQLEILDLEDQSLDDLFNNLKIYEAESSSPQLDNDDLKQIDADDLEEMDLKWQMAMLTMRVRRKSQFDVLSYKTGLESIEARLVVYQQNENVFEEDIKLLKLDVMLRDNALVELRKKYEKAKKERDELKLKLENFQTSSKNLIFDCVELISSESNESVPTSPVHDRYKLGEGYHAVPPPYIGTFMPPKPDLVFHDASTVSETVPTNHEMRVNHQNSARMTHPHSKKHVVPTAVLTRSRLVPLNAARPVTTSVLQTNVKHKRPVKHVVNKPHSPIRRPINHRPAPKNSNFHQKVTTVKAKQVNVVHGTKEKWVWIPKCTFLDHVSRLTSASMTLKQFDYTDALGRSNGCSRHMTGNISYLSDFEEINEGYVAFGGNPECGKITAKGKIKIGKLDFDDVYFVKELKFNLFSVSQMCDKKNSVLFTDTECIVLSFDFKLPDENHTLLRVPRENNMYNVDLKNIVPSGDSTCLFAKATLDENQPNSSAGIQENLNADVDATFDDKESESEVYVFPSSSDKPKKHDEKAKREAKGKSLVELSTGVRDLSDEFEEFFVNSTYMVNAASTPVTAVRPNSTNSTNNFNVAGPSDNVVSPNIEICAKYSFVDLSQYPNDPNMPALEDIVYSDDEEDVGAEDDFSNLEISIIVSPIPTTRVHKDHPFTQIIGDLSSAPQIRSMTRAVKEQGGLTQINNDDFHTCMFACFLSQEEPKRVHQALKDPSWIEAMHEELLQFKMQKEEGIDYEEVSAPVARIEAIRLFLAYASFMGFMVYQMDVKSSFLYGTIEEEVYVCQPLGFENPNYPDKVYKVVKALYGLHQALRAWYETLSTYLLENGFQRGKIDQTLFIKKQKGDIFLVQYPKDSPFNLVAYSDSDYAGASLDRKFTTRGCQFLGCILISWQCKKQTVIATSSTKAEYVATVKENQQKDKIRSKPGKNMKQQSCRFDLGYSFELIILILATCQSKTSLLCFLNKGIRLKSSFLCVTWLSVCTLDRPMRNKGCATWDLGQMHMGRSGCSFGTVPMCVRVHESEYKGGVFLAGKFVKGEVNDEVQKVVEEVVEDTTTSKLIVDATQVSTASEVNAASIATTVSTAGDVLQEPSESITTTTIIISLKKSQDKGKAIMIEEHVKPKKKDQVRRKEEQTTNTSSTNKIMCTYLNNMEGKKLKDLKNKSFNTIQKMFDRAFNRVNTFVDFKTELVEGSSKRVGEELTQESAKKQKVDDDKETTNL
uniref:Uncharacterized protein n=1 Tax=Tanacetum cinerariifolium TaxID=118510 RepID=A0A6L2LEX5_TANCI|nr:hypothetical protein [Tanacetum cinerariifolium]